MIQTLLRLEGVLGQEGRNEAAMSWRATLPRKKIHRGFKNRVCSFNIVHNLIFSQSPQ